MTADGELGLKRGTVRLVESTSSWATTYAELADALISAPVDECAAVEHIGSTAVPGLVAKPILDIALLLRSGYDARSVTSSITQLGYEDRGDKGEEGGHLFVLASATGDRFVHLHALADGDAQWHDYLRFRDWLREDETSRAAYGQLKRVLARRFPNDRAAYMSGKAAFIDGVVRFDRELERTREAVETAGPGVLVLDDLRVGDLSDLGWSGGALHIRSVGEFLERVAKGEVEYLAIRGVEGRVVAKGAIVYPHARDAGVIVQLVTHARLRGLGLGSTLIAAAEHRMRRRGKVVAVIGVEDNNRLARALYERLGYRVVGHRTASWEAEAADGSPLMYTTVLTELEKPLAE